jgi:hypothetical protein
MVVRAVVIEGPKSLLCGCVYVNSIDLIKVAGKYDVERKFKAVSILDPAL